MISQTLEKLGFSNKEMEVYLAVLRAGKVSHNGVSKLTGINRSTVYSVVDTLKSKGVLSEDLAGKVTYIVPHPTDSLTALVEKQEKELKKKRQLVYQAIDELADTIKDQKYSVPKIRFIEEEDLEDYLYKQVPLWDESLLKCDGVWWGFQDTSFVKHYEEWIDWYWEKGAKEGTTLKLLSNEEETKIKGKTFERREIKFWEKSKNFSATTWINGDYVIMIVTNQRPHYMVEIHDKVLAHNNREVFKNLWKEIK